MNVFILVEFSAAKHMEGTNNLIFEVSKRLKSEGHNVFVFSPNWNRKITSRETEIWEKEGIKVKLFWSPFLFNPFVRTLAYFFSVFLFSLRNRVGLFYGVYTLPPSIASILLAKLFGKKCRVSIYEPNACKRISKLSFLKPLFRNIKISTLAEPTRKMVSESFGVPMKNVFLTPGFVDLKRFRPGKKDKALVKKFGLEKSFTLLHVGRISRLKGIPFLLRAMQKTGKDVRLLLAGREVEGEDYQRLANELGLGERVKFLGFVSDETLPKLYNSADAFVLLALSEGFGMVLTEAFASGKPAVASSVQPIPWVVGNAGITVDPENVSGIAEAIREMRSRHKVLSRNALQRAKEFEKKKVMDFFSGFLFSP